MVREQLGRGCYLIVEGPGVEPAIIDTDSLTTRLSRHTIDDTKEWLRMFTKLLGMWLGGVVVRTLDREVVSSLQFLVTSLPSGYYLDGRLSADR